MLRELRIALRTLTRRPGSSAVVIGLLALGIGANVLIFSIVQSILMRPLDFPEGDRLMRVFVRQDVSDNDRLRANAEEFREWRDGTDSFERLVAASNFGMSITESEEPLNPLMRQVSSGWFETFGVTPMLGRGFEPEHHRTMAKVVILDHGFWQSYYGGDPDVVGSTLELAGEPHEILGVMPDSWFQPAFPSQPVLWAPMAETADFERPGGSLVVIGLLKGGVSGAQAERQLTAIQKNAASDRGEEAKRSARVVELRASLVESLRPALLALFGAITFMLLIVLSNVAHLLLAKAIGRRQEMGIRVALGAGGGHLLRQLLTEGLLVGCAGGLVGIFLAASGLPVVVRSILVDLSAMSFGEPRIDGIVIAYALGLSVATGVLCALLPMWQARRGAADVVRPDGRGGGTGPGRRRWQSALLVAEVGLSMALLVGAGLMVRSFAHLRGLDLGFESDDVITVRIGPRGPGLETPEEQADFYRRALAEVRQLPGVEAAGGNEILPMFASFRRSLPVRTEDAPADGDAPGAVPLTVTDGYFATLGTPLLAGRTFRQGDRADSEPVAVLSRTVAESLWGTSISPGDAVGKRIRLGDGPDAELVRVVGVAADLRGLAQAPEPPPIVYRPIDQRVISPVSVFLRTRAGSDRQAIFDAFDRTIWGFSSEIPSYGHTTLDQVVRNIEWQPRTVTQALTSFATLALLLTAAGIYAVLTFAVAERTREIGVRVALGADRGQILRWIVGDAGRLTALGIAVGFGLSLLGTRLLGTQIQGVSPFDPLTYVTLALVLGSVGLLAAYLPARRALRVDPSEALRAD